MGKHRPWFVTPAAGAAGAALVDVDWARHPLGPPDAWPTELTAVLATVLADPMPTVLWWGEGLWQFANEAFWQVHAQTPQLLRQGAPAQKLWTTHWPRAELGLCDPQGGEKLTCDFAALSAAVGHSARGLAERPVATAGPLSPLYDVRGRLMGARAVGAAHTADARMLRELGHIFERMNDAFVLIAADWTILRVNPQHERLTRLPRQAQEGKNFLELFFTDPWGRRSIYWRNYHHCMQHRVSMAFEGFYAPTEMHTATEVYPTEEGGLAIFFRDITADKVAAAAFEHETYKLEAVFSRGPSAMALLAGNELRFEKVNARYVNLVGGRNLLGLTYPQAFPELKDGPYLEIMRQVMRDGKPYYAQERNLKMVTTPGGAPVDGYYDFSYHCIHDREQKPYGIYIHVKDVTERVRARQKLIDALRARDDLLSICSHELKTPVASMKLSTQSLQRGLRRNDPRATSPERVTRMVDQSSRQLLRLERLIEEMLDFSRINGGRLQLSRKACDLAELARGALERLRPQLEAAGSQASLEDQGPVLGEWDSFRLEQVLDNLVSNAVKYGGGKPIAVKLTACDETATVAIHDGGPGIAPADHERIFRPYERAVPHNNISGLGLGLYISREIAEAHGGALRVHSAPGQGATFEIELPRKACAAPPATKEAP